MPHRLTPLHVRNYLHSLATLTHHGGHEAGALHHAATVVGLSAENPEFALHLHNIVLHHLRQAGHAQEAARLHDVTTHAVNAAGQQATQILQQQMPPQQGQR